MPRPRLYLLGPVRGHAVLPAGAGSQLARDLPGISGIGRETQTLGSAHRAVTLDFSVCQSTSPLAVVSNRVFGTAGPLSTVGPQRPSQVPLQEQTAQSRRHRHRSILDAL